MRITHTMIAALLAMIFQGLFAPLHPVSAQISVVRAVIFYSPTCGHCEKVLTQDLPPILEQFGDRLEIIAVNVAAQDGAELFKSGLQAYGQTSSGVPALAIGNYWLVGSVDIPEQLPGLVEEYLQRGGLDWPEIPGLETAMAAVATPPAENSPAQEEPAFGLPGASRPAGVAGAFAQDPAGNTLAVIVLLGMLTVLIWAIVKFRHPDRNYARNHMSGLIPLLALAGLGVAAYLAYVEVKRVEAFCGPVGDCNTVQQSEYARLFGVIPIGVLGLMGYGIILLLWIVAHFARRRAASRAWLAILGMTALGLLFSIYLTYLEPFVIGASCAWCLTSAAIMTALFALSLAPGRIALTEFR